MGEETEAQEKTTSSNQSIAGNVPLTSDDSTRKEPGHEESESPNEGASSEQVKAAEQSLESKDNDDVTIKTSGTDAQDSQSATKQSSPPKRSSAAIKNSSADTQNNQTGTEQGSASKSNECITAKTSDADAQSSQSKTKQSSATENKDGIKTKSSSADGQSEQIADGESKIPPDSPTESPEENDKQSSKHESKEEVTDIQKESNQNVDETHEISPDEPDGNEAAAESLGTLSQSEQLECGEDIPSEDGKEASSDHEESADVLQELPEKSIMLIPIQEPDFSDLADKEKLFPRPAISNPKVAYKLGCKQLEVVPISQYIRSLETSAEDLRLQSYGLARLDMLPLCHSLAYNTTATSLNLSNNRLEDNVLPNIQAMMNDNSFINTINLSRNNLTGPGLGSLQVMLSNNYTLTSLNLSHCHLLDADAPALAAVIEVSLNLRELNLSHNELSESGKVLGTALATDEAIETLNLSWNMFRSRSALDLLMSLRGNSRLRRLDLAWNSMGPDTARGIRNLLKKNGTLVELDVSHNRLRDSNMRPVGLGLVKNHVLEKIWIGYNPVTPVGALAIMKALAKASIHYIDMSQIEVSRDFVTLKDKLDPETITVVHGTINKDMVLIVPAQKKGPGPPLPVKKK